MDNRTKRVFILAILVILVCAAFAHRAAAETMVNASALALRSTGAVSEASDWTLGQSGYLGTYVVVEQAGDVPFSVAARGRLGVKMNLVVGDSRVTFDVADSAAFRDYEASVSLPAGTHVVRIDYANDSDGHGGRELTVRSLTVGDKASVLNSHTDAHALTAADTYVQRYRRGEAVISLRRPDGAPLANIPVRFKLRRHAFTFGNSVPGFNARYSPPDWWISGDTTDGRQFRQKLLENFNGIVAENAGKWNAVEVERGQADQSTLDQVATFAHDHHLRLRGHTHVWPSPDGLPSFADQWLTEATDPAKPQAARDAAKTAFSEALADRVRHSLSERRGKRYVEFDVLSEAGGRHFHYDANDPPPTPQRPLPQNRLWTLFGAAGQAAMFEQIAAAMRSGGDTATLMIDDFNVLQWNAYQGTAASDGGYSNNYRWYVEAVAAALLPQSRAQLGIGMQYYADTSETADRHSPHSPARMAAVMQNLSGLGVPLSLSGFGVSPAADEAEAAAILADTLRMTFGTAGMQSYWHWGMWAGDVWKDFPAGVLFDRDWRLTQSGKVWQQMLGIRDWGIQGVPTWTTDVALTTDGQGQVRITSFYGTHDVTTGGRTYPLEIVKGTTSYAVDVAMP